MHIGERSDFSSGAGGFACCEFLIDRRTEGRAGL